MDKFFQMIIQFISFFFTRPNLLEVLHFKFVVFDVKQKSEVIWGHFKSVHSLRYSVGIYKQYLHFVFFEQRSIQ